MKRIGFRGRLFLILLGFALVPTILISLAWSTTGSLLLPYVGATAAWDRVAETGQRALDVARDKPLTPPERQLIDAHEANLREGVTMSRRTDFLSRELARQLIFGTLVAALLIGFVGSRVAGHLSRNLSRPLQELVGWTERIGRGESLPTTPPRRGAPEFEVLRRRMREMSAELELGRARALEAERASTLRETARQVAHELKNPLTPIRFAVDSLRRNADRIPPELGETIEVLAIESARLEEMARSFAQFGRLPEGPRAEVDVGELARATARTTIPPGMDVDIDVEDGVPMIEGHHDALARALSNVLLNAVDACGASGKVGLRVRRLNGNGRSAVELTVSDNGCGIPPEKLARIWDPYVTSKPGGTGLGLAIARQTVLAHAGAVDATSTPGVGTEIRFVLPVNGEGERNAGTR